MSQTIVGEGSGPYPSVFGTPVIELQQKWGGGWEYEPELELVSCGLAAGGLRAETCEVMHRYGNTKLPFDSSFSARTSWDLSGWWMRMSIMGEHGPEPQFIGKIESHAKMLMGSESHPSGDQHWIAAGGLRILERMMVSEAIFNSGTATQSRVGWIPPMNARDRRNLLVGNKNTQTNDDGMGGTSTITAYGGTGIWTHKEYIEYLLTYFVNPNSGPSFVLSGQVDILAKLQTTIRFPQSVSVAQMLRDLIPAKYGIDFQVFPNGDAGYQIAVFALSAQPVTFAGQTMPANSYTVRLDRLGQPDLMETHVVEADERRVDKIEVKGRRIVVCGSLLGPSGSYPGTSLVPKWSAALETAYLNADGTLTGGSSDDNDVEAADSIRRREKFRPVYQHFGAPLDWDMDGGRWSVKCDYDGSLITGQYQKNVRETLPDIPLQQGFDYSVDPPVDNTDGVPQPETQPPLAWILDEQGILNDKPRYVACHLNGMHVSRLYQDWGIQLDASPNHRLAYNHLTTDQLDTSELQDPDFDYETIVATIAIESDHRLGLSYLVPDKLSAGDGSVMTIIDESAECWVLLPGTIVGVDKNGDLQTSGGKQRVLRNDIDRLGLLMAGAVSRYAYERTRAHIAFKGFVPWGQFLGAILDVVQQGDDSQRVGAIITSVEWILQPTPMTIIKTGYA